jgi:transcriptional regulator with GAF, ATPase, and Fis domain
MKLQKIAAAVAHGGRSPIPTRSWTNWVVLATTFIVTTVGMALIIATLLPSRLASPWPWVRTDLALVTTCLFLVLTLVLYLTNEQRHLTKLNRVYEERQKEANETARRRLYALLEVSRAMGMQSDVLGVFNCITRSCVETFGCDQASLMLYDKDAGQLVVQSANGHENVDLVIGKTKLIGEGIAGWVALHKKPLVIGNSGTVEDHPELTLSNPSLRAAMVVPIILREELVGVINITNRSSNVTYLDDDLRALTVFAENAGACIRNAELATWMRSTIEGLRTQLARTGEKASS